MRALHDCTASGQLDRVSLTSRGACRSTMEALERVAAAQYLVVVFYGEPRRTSMGAL